jgi:hypothetical protein
MKNALGFAVAIAALAGVLALGIPQLRAGTGGSCGQCNCYYPNSGNSGVQQNGDCTVCDCWVQ